MGSQDGVRQIDASGRRWYTASFKREIVGQCLVAGASLSKVAIDHDHFETPSTISLKRRIRSA